MEKLNACFRYYKITQKIDVGNQKTWRVYLVFLSAERGNRSRVIVFGSGLVETIENSPAIYCQVVTIQFFSPKGRQNKNGTERDRLCRRFGGKFPAGKKDNSRMDFQGSSQNFRAPNAELETAIFDCGYGCLRHACKLR